MIATILVRLAAATLALAPLTHVVRAQEAPRAQRPAANAIVLEAGAGRVVQVNGSIANLFAADPKVVDVRPVSHSSVFLFATGTGRTTVAALDEAGNTLAQYDVTVLPSSFNAAEAAAAARRQVPGANARFSGAPNGVVLNGAMPSPMAAEQATSAARNYIGEKEAVYDRTTLSSSVQVTLRVRIAEISRTITRQLGINWTALANVGKWGLIANITDGLSSVASPPNQLGVRTPGGSVNTVLDLLAQDQLITMLAEPNLTARSGEVASFLAGGEFPIPVAGDNGRITLTFKQYGVSLSFVPTVLTDGRISLHVNPEVSELTNVGAISLPISTSLFGTSVVTIPALTVRRTDTTVELGSGQSFAIAGLLQANSTMNARGLPYAGEVPILGPLFKSDAFQRDQSELVIVVTPYLVHPVSSPDQLRTPTDDFVPAGDADRLLWMRQRALGTGPDAVVRPTAAALKQIPNLGGSNVPPATGFILH